MRIIAILAALSVFGCKGSTGPAGAAGESALISVAPVTAGANCAAGGFVIKVGIDTNGNGVLDPSEVTSTSYLCNGANGLSGTDGTSGSNGTNGTNGTNGMDGTDGAGAFVTASPLPSGDASCPFGGALLTYGIGTLGSDGGVEPGDTITGTTYVCNAASPWTVCASGCPFTSVRLAVIAAPDGGTVTVGPGTFTGAGITIEGEVTIVGSGAGSTIVQSAASPDVMFAGRVVVVTPGANAVIEGLTIQNGHGGIQPTGQGVNGGGILNQGNLTVRRCTLTGNIAGTSADNLTGQPLNGGSGGAIYSGGSFTVNGAPATPNLVIEDSTISGNSAGGGGNTSTATCSGQSCGFLGGNGGTGGGVAIGSGTLSIKGSTIAGNSAGAYGLGCMCMFGGCNNAPFVSNGGGISLAGGTSQIESSTITGNSGGQFFRTCGDPTPTGSGGVGGVYIGTGATAWVSDTTIAANTPGLSDPSGLENHGTLHLFATAFDDSCWAAGDGSASSLGYNLLDNGEEYSCPAIASDIVSSAPMLGGLGDNGGPTQTMLPQAGSPLIDAIPLAHCNDYPIGPVDQRGQLRPSGSGCDIGAVEVQ